MSRSPWSAPFRSSPPFSAASPSPWAPAARLDAQALEWVDTAVRYQMWHALALLGAAALAARHPALALSVAGWAWVLGIVLFCGALYALAFTGVRGFAHVVPAGGLALIAGWVALLWYAVASLR